ncbi:MAG: MMPL family transporter [Oscillibacter sp.]|nr:MMPL family transporter [Oscillibacter sp.]
MKESKTDIWDKIATVIVDKRNIVFLFFAAAVAFCAVASGWVQTNDDITSYLPGDTETRQGLDIMDQEFITYATARVMVENITLDRAMELQRSLESIHGVTSAAFYDPEDEEAVLEDFYKDASALFTVTFDGENEDPVSVEAMAALRQRLAGYDAYISSEVGAGLADTLDGEIRIVMLVAVFIIVTVLLFTSKTYLEIPVLLLTFGTAALLNMGTNYMMGEISFVTNSVAVILQLALAIDYAIILCHRYTEEREVREAREACIAALAKSIPEISSSSLTTISGLLAMTFMRFRIGYDMGVVLIKAILLSLLTVFTLMPGLLMLFSRGIDKTHHRSFVPKIDAWGRMTVKSRYIVPPLFALALIAGFFFSNRCPYVYGYSTLETFRKNENQIADAAVNGTFGGQNLMALLVPEGDYPREKALLAELSAMEHVETAMGLSNIEALDGYMLTDALTPRQLAELLDMDYEAVSLLYAAYAADGEDYGRIAGGLSDFSVPLIDMVFFIYDQKEAGYLSLGDSLEADLDDMYAQLSDAKAQLEGEHYSRMLLYLDLPEESQETFDYLQTLHQTAERYYDTVYLVGNSTSDYDLSTSFVGDNLLISVLSALFVIVVLVFTFRSAGLPILLIIVIQGSIFINFSFPYLMESNLFFLSYLIVNSIQMGANIDYAIVISSRYVELRTQKSSQEAIQEALNLAFPTIVTSGSILSAAGILIYFLTSQPAITAIGECLGRGTLISMLLVMGVLPQILVLGDTIIEKTAFVLKRPIAPRRASGTIRIHGRVRGYISGVVDAEIHGILQGSVSAMVETQGLEQLDLLPEAEEREEAPHET